MGAEDRTRPVQLASEGAVQDFVDERTLARAADPGDRDEQAERKRDVDVLEVILTGTLDDEGRRAGGVSPLMGGSIRGLTPPARRLWNAAIRRDRNCLLSGEVLSRQRRLGALHLFRRARRGDLAALVAGAGAEVEQVIRRADHLAIVLVGSSST